ncbi:hypothetical protein Maq22A_c27440 [Methylobacterium aquaticum]|uniref:Uncharacterized protein n=1 Tax=Methylobacterium aquaticum TaxID=270351 RepID=A0A0C6FS77_9HYPH|nr:hypothetical protein Maq22A_c27440 [Methylobacterium aquaticum]
MFRTLYRNAGGLRQGCGAPRTRVSETFDLPLENVTCPTDPHHRPGRGVDRVGERELCAGPLDQGLGDEQAEAEPRSPVGAGRRRAAGADIGLAHPQQHLRGEARSVVADLERDPVGAPARLDRHAALGEVDRVVDDVAEPEHHPRVAPAGRLRAFALRGHVEDDAEGALGRHQLLDEVAEGDGLDESALVGVERGELGEDAAAALDLVAQERQVLGDARVRRGAELAVEFLGHHRDGGERRAEFVGRRRRQPVELRQVLLAGEHQLGRGERPGELARLLGDPPGVDPREGGAEQDRGPDARDVQERQFQGLAGEPRQRPVDEGEHRRQADGEEPQRQGVGRGQRGRGDQHGCQEEQRERVLQPAGEEEERRELDDVEGEEQHRRVVAEPMARRVADAQRQVEPGRGRDDEEAPAERQGQAEAEMGAGHRGTLARHGEPAQPHQGVEAQVAGVPHGIGLRGVEHRENDSAPPTKAQGGAAETLAAAARFPKVAATGPAGRSTMGYAGAAGDGRRDLAPLRRKLPGYPR